MGDGALSVASSVPEQLAAIEDALARHRAFGDSNYIHEQLRVCLGRRLKRVATQLPVAGQLYDALDAQPDSDQLRRLIGDLVFRCAVLHAHTQVESGAPCGLALQDCEAIFATTLQNLEHGKTDTPLQDGTLLPLGRASYLGWVWSDEHPDDIFGRSFRYLVGDHYGALPLTPTARELETLYRGVELLQILLPLATQSALSHAHLIACVPSAGSWTGMASGSNFQLGGTIFLGRSLPNPWWVAEHLLHEAVHQKLYDFRHGHSLLVLGTPRDVAPRVWSPWNPVRLDRANYWDTNRVFAAFHVYVHVALLALVAERRAPELEESFGPLQGMTDSRTALDRAWYLGHRLKEQCSTQLGPAGESVHEWLMAALECMDPDPPPKGAYLHFALDVYRRDAARVGKLLENKGPESTDLAEQLAPLARRERQDVEAVLEALDAPDASRSLVTAIDQWDDELGMRFPEVRGQIAAALLGVSPDGYRLNDSGSCDEMVEHLLGTAGSSLYALIQRIPPLVAEARRRASQLAFAMSCRDDTGRLLQVLAGGVCHRGRILEIGTGAGVGTAWMITGLGRRTDVELISVEIQPILSRRTREGSPWPEFVQFLNADAAEAMASLGSFDLVFADAAPVKYGGLDAVVRALHPGGFVVIDDFKTNARTSESRREEIDTMRRSLVQHPQLNTVELDWSSGIIVASRKHSVALVSQPLSE